MHMRRQVIAFAQFQPVLVAESALRRHTLIVWKLFP
jgi:hypothetical protein